MSKFEPFTVQGLEPVDLVKSYREYFPGRQAQVEPLWSAIEKGRKLDRSDLWGHYTASAFLVYQGSLLLIHHKFLQRWLPPAGHRENDECMWECARRELLEETNVAAGLSCWHTRHNMIPFQINVHLIPDRPERNEIHHLHFDFRYVFVTLDMPRVVIDPSECEGYAWVPLDELKENCLPPGGGVPIQSSITKLGRELKDIVWGQKELVLPETGGGNEKG